MTEVSSVQEAQAEVQTEAQVTPGMADCTVVLGAYAFTRPGLLSPPVPNASRDNLLKQATTGLLGLYRHLNPDFLWHPGLRPRRALTEPREGVSNDGCDNVNHDYILYVNDIIGCEEDHRYQVLDLVGAGTFGQVATCLNVKTGKEFAVKVVKNTPAYYNQAMVETMILTMLNDKLDKDDEHNCVRLVTHMNHKSHLCLVFELLSVNLYELIKQNQFRGLSLGLIRAFLTQILDALVLLEENGIIHCDLKPENILLRSMVEPAVKVIDFGSACFEGNLVYAYIQSRFYRSPEVLLGLSYTSAIDVWSLGCIAAELFLGIPLFPGTSEYNQLVRIVDMQGAPPEHMLRKGKATSKFFHVEQRPGGSASYQLKGEDAYARENNTDVKENKQYFRYDTLEDILLKNAMKAGTPEEQSAEIEARKIFTHFVKGLLRLDPAQRWTATQARLHPFITGAEMDLETYVEPPLPKPRRSMPMMVRGSHPPSTPHLSRSHPPFSVAEVITSRQVGWPQNTGQTMYGSMPSVPSVASSIASSWQSPSSAASAANAAWPGQGPESHFHSPPYGLRTSPQHHMLHGGPGASSSFPYVHQSMYSQQRPQHPQRNPRLDPRQGRAGEEGPDWEDDEHFLPFDMSMRSPERESRRRSNASLSAPESPEKIGLHSPPFPSGYSPTQPPFGMYYKDGFPVGSPTNPSPAAYGYGSQSPATRYSYASNPSLGSSPSRTSYTSFPGGSPAMYQGQGYPSGETERQPNAEQHSAYLANAGSPMGQLFQDQSMRGGDRGRADGPQQRRGSEGQRRGSEGQRRGSEGQRRISEGQRRGSEGQRRGSEGQRRGSEGQRRGSDAKSRNNGKARSSSNNNNNNKDGGSDASQSPGQARQRKGSGTQRRGNRRGSRGGSKARRGGRADGASPDAGPE